MFRNILRQLRQGAEPDKKLLRQMLQAALVKKIGVLRMPYLCRPRDPKINPPADQLLAVAAILGEEEQMRLCLDILLSEASEKSGMAETPQSEEGCRRLDAVADLLQPFPEVRGRLTALLAATEKEFGSGKPEEHSRPAPRRRQ